MNGEQEKNLAGGVDSNSGPQAVVGVIRSNHVGDSFDNEPNRSINFGGFEPFVDEEVVASFLQITTRQVLEMARSGEIPAHPLGRGLRKRWRFRISEVSAQFSNDTTRSRANLRTAVPGATRRKQ